MWIANPLRSLLNRIAVVSLPCALILSFVIQYLLSRCLFSLSPWKSWIFFPVVINAIYICEMFYEYTIARIRFGIFPNACTYFCTYFIKICFQIWALLCACVLVCACVFIAVKSFRKKTTFVAHFHRIAAFLSSGCFFLLASLSLTLTLIRPSLMHSINICILYIGSFFMRAWARLYVRCAFYAL